MSVHATDVLIIGAGIAGLACMASLPKGCEVVLLEGSRSIGGLLTTHRFGDYIFDTVPHVLFFRDKRLLTAISNLLPVSLYAFRRSNYIWQNDRVITYPYQFNACDLPDHVREECIGAVPDNTDATEQQVRSFRDWLLREFGRGFYAHFFRPYNEKLYGLALSELEAAPLKWTIPRDNRAAILEGARRRQPASNQLLFYPRGDRGIAAIVDALAAPHRGRILTDERVQTIDLSRREVRTAGGQTFRYRKLVSTQPLPDLVDCVVNPPKSVRCLRMQLRAIGIHVVRIGAPQSGPNLRDIWTYFPDSDIPFYRMTRLERISSDLCPPGGTSILLECSGPDIPPQDGILQQLVRLGVLASTDVDHYSVLRVPYAYVLFLHGYRRVVADLRNYLSSAGVFTAGRYGQWMYADIEMAIKSGVTAARRAMAPNEMEVRTLQSLQ
jgi:protoporphyrinogen oxidase